VGESDATGRKEGVAAQREESGDAGEKREWRRRERGAEAPGKRGSGGTGESGRQRGENFLYY
jgi:hypothetical protein